MHDGITERETNAQSIDPPSPHLTTHRWNVVLPSNCSTGIEGNAAPPCATGKMEEIEMCFLTSPRAMMNPPCSRERTWVRWKKAVVEAMCGGRWYRHELEFAFS